MEAILAIARDGFADVDSVPRFVETISRKSSSARSFLTASTGHDFLVAFLNIHIVV